jgi:hypothetical protein
MKLLSWQCLASVIIYMDARAALAEAVPSYRRVSHTRAAEYNLSIHTMFQAMRDELVQEYGRSNTS